MDIRRFVSRCRQIIDDSTRRILMDDNVAADVLQSTLSRIETVQRSLQWARGTLLNVRDADQLLGNLAEYIQEVQALQDQHGDQGDVGFQAPLVWRGVSGAPHYSITREQLAFLQSCGFTARQMADILGVSLSTVRRRVRHFHLGRTEQYANLTDAELDELVTETVSGNDLLGSELVRASLRANGIRVQRKRVRDSMRRTYPGASALRALMQRPQRRVYSVQGPNSLWHIDGNHKLIRWRIVIHGGMDGYSRLIVFLRASDNNRSATVLDNFVGAVARNGVPSRVRTDRGGENNAVCLFMNIFRGFRRGSAIQGRSVHNQRIERLWADLWRGVSNVYHALFHFLEGEGIVDPDNERHIWALHYIYLPRLNRDLTDFMSQWNNHGLRTERHLSPRQIFVRGCLQQQSRPSTAMQGIFGDPPAAAAAPAAAAPPPAALPAPAPPPAAAAVPAPAALPAAAAVPAPAAPAPAAAPPLPADIPADVARLLDWPERVSVPRIDFTVEGAVADQIHAQFDPLSGPRGELGIPLIRGLVSFLDAL